MRLSLAFVVVGVLVAVRAGEYHKHQPRQVAAAVRIQRLRHDLEELDHELDEAKKIDPIGFVKNMHERLNLVEGSECPPHEVQCGWDSLDCVSELGVCDGIDDCQNGWDESERTCSHGPIVAGNVFTGTADWISCQPWREHPISVKITGVMTSKFFPPRLGVTAHIVGDVPHENIHFEGDIEGYYVYGAKRLVMSPVRRKHMDLSFICDFNHGDDKQADCQIIYEASKFKCAEMLLHLEHLDTHHSRHRDTHHRHHDDYGEDHRGEIVEHHYDFAGHDHAEHFDRRHRRIAHEDDDHYVLF